MEPAVETILRADAKYAVDLEFDQTKVILLLKEIYCWVPLCLRRN